MKYGSLFCSIYLIALWPNVAICAENSGGNGKDITGRIPVTLKILMPDSSIASITAPKNISTARILQSKLTEIKSLKNLQSYIEKQLKLDLTKVAIYFDLNETLSMDKQTFFNGTIDASVILSDQYDLNNKKFDSKKPRTSLENLGIKLATLLRSSKLLDPIKLVPFEQENTVEEIQGFIKSGAHVSICSSADTINNKPIIRPFLQQLKIDEKQYISAKALIKGGMKPGVAKAQSIWNNLQSSNKTGVSVVALVDNEIDYVRDFSGEFQKLLQTSQLLNNSGKPVFDEQTVTILPLHYIHEEEIFTEESVSNEIYRTLEKLLKVGEQNQKHQQQQSINEDNKPKDDEPT